MTGKTTYFPTVKGLNRALRSLPKHATKRLRDASVVIAQKEAGRAAGKARSLGGVAALVAPSIRGTRDRVPLIKMGGAKRLPPRASGGRAGTRQTVGDVWGGAEFGSNRYTQFAPWTGKTGRFLYPTIRADSDEIHDEYSDALLKALEDIK